MKKTIIALIVFAVSGSAVYLYRGRQETDRNGPGARYETFIVKRGNIEVSSQSTASVRPQNRLQIKPPLAGRIEEVRAKEGDAVKAGQTIAVMSSSDRAAVLDAARARGGDALARWMDVYKATPVMAPLDGTIIARNIEPGQAVSAADDLFVLSDVLIIEAQVDETDLGSVATGQSCRIVIDAYPDRPFSGRVSHIAFEAKTVQNVTVYAVEIMPDEIPPFMRSGMTAHVTFLAKSAQGVLCIPVEAVQGDGLNKSVNVGDPEKNAPVAIKTGLSDGRMIEVQTGLAEGDVVLVPRIISGQLDDSRSNPFMPLRRGAGFSGGSRR